MTPVRLFVSCLVVLSLGWASALESAPAVAHARQSSRALASGSQSQITTARERLVTSQAEWTALWAEHAPGQPAPAVDFARSSVVALFLGTRPTAGYGIRLREARVDGDTLMVRYEEQTPGPDTMAAELLTSPFLIVALPRHSGPVRFDKRGR